MDERGRTAAVAMTTTSPGFAPLASEDTAPAEVDEPAAMSTMSTTSPGLAPLPREPAAPAEIDEPAIGAIGRFVVLRRLGAGAMGAVYLAYDNALDRRVALKLLRRHRAGRPGEALRMQREAQLLARLSHPHVVHVHEVGAWQGRVYVAMEYVAGRSLAAALRDPGPGDPARRRRELLALFVQAGRGLSAAHRAGVVHRDFKPDKRSGS